MIPMKGSLVVHPNKAGMRGKVLSVVLQSVAKVIVRWSNQEEAHYKPEELQSGWRMGDEVVVYSQNQTDILGVGEVVSMRSVAGHKQVMVDLYEDNQAKWYQWQNLRENRSSLSYLNQGQLPQKYDSEYFRLQQLAYMISYWQYNTGSLSQLDIDPLPHQVALVHRILTSGNLNWLIADDVGLGKTISVGLLITALKARRMKRFLIVVPAGLTKQWQEEMFAKFNMSDFQIYGQDFQINEPRHWYGKNHVIISLDLAKREEHREKLAFAEDWDYIIFDEAHRLTRNQNGLTLHSSERYELASFLRKRTQNILLLTGTPHQGKMDKFRSLLELLKTDKNWRREVNTLQLNPEKVKEFIIRNRKSEVTDSRGKLIFKEKTAYRIHVELSEAEKELDKELQLYFNKGYSAGEKLGTKGNAIGFVMTVYRKLASSSLAAIYGALKRRLEKVEGKRFVEFDDNMVEDERFIENEEYAVDSQKDIKSGQVFFENEVEMLRSLISLLGELVKKDSKKTDFLDKIVKHVLEKNPNEKILIFTEYRSTQEDLQKALERLYPKKVAILNGSMNLYEKRDVINAFDNNIQFLISTEAGGEGLNLQRQCHIMVNYDLPWNPMRLVQRVGRLYRYGQQKNVVVFNLQCSDTLDNDILDKIYERLEKVSQDLGGVSQDYASGLQDEIMGQLSLVLDIKTLLTEAMSVSRQQTNEHMEEALEKAKDAVKQQQNILEHASGFDADFMKDQVDVELEHLHAFFLGMMGVLRVEIVNTTQNNRVWEIRLNDEVKSMTGLLTSTKVTFDRHLAAKYKEIYLLDIAHPLLRYFLDKAMSTDFVEPASVLEGEGVFVSAILAWQNDKGMMLREEYVLLHYHQGEWTVNSPDVSKVLTKPQKLAQHGEHNPIKPRAIDKKEVQKILDELLNAKSKQAMMPVSSRVLGVAWLYPDKK